MTAIPISQLKNHSVTIKSDRWLCLLIRVMNYLTRVTTVRLLMTYVIASWSWWILILIFYLPFRSPRRRQKIAKLLSRTADEKVVFTTVLQLFVCHALPLSSSAAQTHGQTALTKKFFPFLPCCRELFGTRNKLNSSF